MLENGFPASWLAPGLSPGYSLAEQSLSGCLVDANVGSIAASKHRHQQLEFAAVVEFCSRMWVVCLQTGKIWRRLSAFVVIWGLPGACRFDPGSLSAGFSAAAFWLLRAPVLLG